jgi:hypothetical protein
MRQIPQTTVLNPGAPAPRPNPANGSSGQVGGAIAPTYSGVRRDFTFTPLFKPELSVNGQTGVPRG